MRLLKPSEHCFQRVWFARAGRAGNENYSVPIIKRLLNCFLLAWFNPYLVEVAKDWILDSNDDGASVIGGCSLKAQSPTLSLAGSRAEGDIDFSTFAALHQLVAIATRHIAKSICEVFHSSGWDSLDWCMDHAVCAHAYAACAVSRDHMDIAGASFYSFEKNLFSGRTESRAESDFNVRFGGICFGSSSCIWIECVPVDSFTCRIVALAFRFGFD